MSSVPHAGALIPFGITGDLGMSQLEAATVSWYRSAATRDIMPALGSVKLAKLSPVMVELFLADKAENGRLDGKGGLGPASVRRLQVTLHKALDAAVRKGILTRNPADLAESPRMPPRDVTIDVWTAAELARFVEATQTDRLAAVWRLAAMSGLRRSELVGLQWPDIDLDRGWLSVRRSVVIVDGGPPRVKPPKTARSRRTVELDGRTISGLREWRRTNLRGVCARAKRGNPENGSWPTNSVRISDLTGSESDLSLFQRQQGSEPSRSASFATATPRPSYQPESHQRSFKSDWVTRRSA